jgi:hypothetical protein
VLCMQESVDNKLKHCENCPHVACFNPLPASVVEGICSVSNSNQFFQSLRDFNTGT